MPKPNHLNRRTFLQHVQVGALASTAAVLSRRSSIADDSVQVKGELKPLNVGVGPQLFLDDYMIQRNEGFKRQVQPPERLPQPVLDSKTFGTSQPYMTVLRDPQENRYRMWYNNAAAVWHAESAHGIHWANPQAVWNCEHCFGASLLDDSEQSDDPERRFKLANWQATRIKEDKPGDDGGMWLGFSADGLRWTPHDRNPVLPTWPEGYGKFVHHGAQDIVDVFYDPLKKHYAVALKIPAESADGYAQGPRAGESIRRLVGMSTSKDFIHWEKPWRILSPDEKDDGLLEFYGMGGIHLRGSLYIGLVRVLRDDLPCDPNGPKDGIGYAVLATSRDGVAWQRYREPFLDRNPEPGSWDHAMTWLGYTLPMEDETWFYYGGYARGHKVESATERQLGLARMKKDRYVALMPEREEARIVTPPFVLPSGKLTINAQATGGAVTVRLLDPTGKPIVDFANESAPIAGDVLAADARWPQPLSALQGRPVQLEIHARKAALFGFEFHA